MPFHAWLGIEKLSETEANIVFTLLVADAFIAMNGLALMAGLRARRLVHVGLLLRAGTSIMILSLVMIGVTWFDAGPVEAAAIQVCVRLVEFAVHLVILKRQRLTVPFSPWHRNREPMRPFVITGLEYMLFPLGEAMLLQGMTLLVGVFTTPVVVAAFATHRTLSRITAQVLHVAVNPVRAEAGLMQGEANRHELARVVIGTSRLTLWASLILVGILLAFGGWIFATWTHGHVSFDSGLLAVLACATVIEGVWRVPSSVRLGTNRHRPLATGFLFSSLLGLACAAVLVLPAGIVGMAWGMVIAQLAMCLITIPLTTPLIGMGNAAYLRAVARPPVAELRAGWRMIRSRIG
jgi:O-antigen/teichoic acid export membrane protein